MGRGVLGMMARSWRVAEGKIMAAWVVGGCLSGVACHRDDTPEPSDVLEPSGPCGLPGVLSFVTLRDGGDCDNESAPNGLTRTFRMKHGADASYTFVALDGDGYYRPNMSCEGEIDACHLDLTCSGTVVADTLGASKRKLTETYDIDLRPDGRFSGTESVAVTREGQSCQGEYVVVAGASE